MVDNQRDQKEANGLKRSLIKIETKQVNKQRD